MKYFAVSDIHSSYDALITSLSEAGYEKDNPNHTLIVDGDIFDRGEKPLEVYKYLSSINPHNIVLIRGNHEDLYLELLDKETPDSYDYSNGTVNTFLAVVGIKPFEDYVYIEEYLELVSQFNAYLKMNNTTWKEVTDKVRVSEITSFLNEDRWVNFFELDKYIFTHGFLPYWRGNEWRKCDDTEEWKDAHFEYAYEYMYMLKNMFKDNVLVVGHLHSYFYHSIYEGIETGLLDDSIFHKDNIYVIDTYVRRSEKLGVLVIDDSLNVTIY